VIHVTSSSVHGPYIPDFSSYRASKTGATKLFELFHCEHPELFVLQIHPGLIGGTDMHSKFAHMTEGLEFDDGMLDST
jgi:NAD(P)-dependent dehydrogenase (short-subunit alcohol dehydrogenase family)